MRKIILSFIICMMAICSCTDRDNQVILSQIRELSQIRAYQYSVTAMKYGKEKGGALFGDKVTGYYNGHVDVGIGSVDDITMQVSDDGTTATINAEASVLNAKGWFIDGAPHYIGGSGFSNADMKQLDKEANDSIYRHFLTSDGKAEAEANLREKLSETLHALGYDSVVVNVTFKANPQGR